LFYASCFIIYQIIRDDKIWEGGLASHGAGKSAYYFNLSITKKQKIKRCMDLDRLVIVVALAAVLIRLEIYLTRNYRKAADVPWAFIFAKLMMWPRHPAPII